MARFLGVDPGSVRVGLALSDASGLLASPLATIPRRGHRGTAEAIRDLAAEHGVGTIVVGIPLAMDGSEQESTRDARRLAEAIERATGVPVVGWDERLTTALAERALIEADVRRDRRRQVVDRVAAAVLLQSYLDHVSAAAASAPPEPTDR